jgi:hypothetical protein
MTVRELQKRARLFMGELGRAEPMASLDERTGWGQIIGSDGSLQAALHRFAQRYAAATSSDALGPEPYGAYADAFAFTTKTNQGGMFRRDGRELHCDPCGELVVSLGGAEVTREGAIAHVLRVTHLGRAEARATKAKAS